MKKIVLLLTLALTLLPALCRAQNYIVPTTQGTILEYASFDADGNVTDRVRKTVEKVTPVRQGTEVILRTDILNEDGTPNTDFAVMRETIIIAPDKIVKLKDGTADFFREMVMKSAGGQFSGEDLDKIDFIVEGDDMVYPVLPKEGEKLKNTSVTMRIEFKNAKEKEKSIKLATINSSGVIDGMERVSTKAGTFECFRISKTVKFKAMMGMVSDTERMITWYAPGVGEVMSQEVTKRGKVESTTKLVSVKTP